MNDEQCRGTTKSGTRCKIRVGLVNGYCSRHRDQAGEKSTEKKNGNVPGEQAFPEPDTAEPEPAGNPMPREHVPPVHGKPCECCCGGATKRGVLLVVAAVGVAIALLWRMLRHRSS